MKQFFILMTLAVLFSCSGNEELLLNVDYSNWQKTHNVELNYPVPGHGSAYRKVYINNIGAETLTANAGLPLEFPDGTIIIKEVYPSDTNTGEAPVKLYGMIKSADSEKAQGGWIWMTKNLETGKESVVGQSFCIKCHEDANTVHKFGQGNPEGLFRDYTFYTGVY